MDRFGIFVDAGLEQVGDDGRKSLLDTEPRSIPPEVDRLLLAYASKAMGVVRVQDPRAVRRGFWEALEGAGR